MLNKVIFNLLDNVFKYYIILIMTDNQFKRLKDIYSKEAALNISVLFDKFYKLIEEAKEDDHPENNESLLLRFNKLYWEIVNAIVHIRVLDNNEEGLMFSESEALFLNYSWVDDELVSLKHEESDLHQILKQDMKNDYDVDGKLGILDFTEMLSRFYLDIFQFAKNKMLQESIASMQKTILEIPDRIIELQRGRNNIQSASLHAKAMQQYTAQIEKIFPVYYEMQRKINKGMALKPEKRKEYASIKHVLDQLKNKKSFLLQDVTKVGDSDRITQLDKEIEQLMIDKVELKYKTSGVEDEIVDLNLKQEALAKQAAETSDVMRPVIERMSANALLCAKRLYKVPCSLRVSERQNLITKKDVVAVVEKIEAFDRTLFTDKDEFYPSFMIIPAIGNAIYDWKDKMILIPIIPATNVEDSVIAGIVDYKFTIDEEHELEHSYYELHPELKRMGMIKIRETFFNEYSTWVLKESEGVMTFKKPEREWFEKEIAPRKNSLRMPRYVRYNIESLDGIAKLNEMADQYLKENVESVEGHMLKGFVHFAKNEFEQSKEFFGKAINFDNNNEIAVYNYIMVCFALRLSGEMKTWVKQYSTIDKGSWWRSNVQKIVMDLRSMAG